MAKRIQNQKEEERVVSKSRPAAMNLSSSMATTSSTASSPIASKSPGIPIASGKPDSRMSVEPSSSDAASTSQARLKDAYLGGLSGETRRIKKKELQKPQTILRLEPGTTKRNLLPKTVKLGGNPWHTEPVLQLIRKVKSIRKRHGTTTCTT